MLEWAGWLGGAVVGLHVVMSGVLLNIYIGGLSAQHRHHVTDAHGSIPALSNYFFLFTVYSYCVVFLVFHYLCSYFRFPFPAGLVVNLCFFFPISFPLISFLFLLSCLLLSFILCFSFPISFIPISISYFLYFFFLYVSPFLFPFFLFFLFTFLYKRFFKKLKNLVSLRLTISFLYMSFPEYTISIFFFGITFPSLVIPYLYPFHLLLSLFT